MIGPATSKELAARIVRWIAESRLKQGAKLPSSRALADEWRVGRTAMNNAMLQLVLTGVLNRDGYKLTVSEPAAATVRARHPVHLFYYDKVEAKVVAKLVSRWGMTLQAHEYHDATRLRKSVLELLTLPTAGVLIDKCAESDVLRELEKRNIPVVVYGAEWPGHAFVAPRATPIASLAIGHLVALGHRRMAYLAAPLRISYPYQRFQVETDYPEACRKAGLPPGAERMIVLEGDDRNTVTKVVQKLLQEDQRPTALLCENIKIATAAMDVCAKAGLKVPRDLSVLCLFDNPIAARCDPPVTALGLEPGATAKIATLLLLDEIESRAARINRGVFHSIYCEPVVILRASTGPAPGFAQALKPETVAPNALTLPQTNPWPNDIEERRRLVRMINNQVFPPSFSGSKKPAIKWVPLNLGGSAQREFRRNNSWFGREPLLHFQSGKQVIHGVPFKLRNRVLVMRSQHAHNSKDEPLPLDAHMPVGLRADCIHILHATGWAGRHRAYASYEFIYQQGSTMTVPIIALGDLTQQGAPTPAQISAASTQDWHPFYPRLTNPHTLPYLVTEDDDPLNYERCLYHYRFVNPHPDQLISEIRVKLFDPEEETTHAVLAVTAQVRT